MTANSSGGNASANSSTGRTAGSATSATSATNGTRNATAAARCEPCVCDRDGVVRNLAGARIDARRPGCALHAVGFPTACYVDPTCTRASASTKYAGVRYRWCTAGEALSEACDERHALQACPLSTLVLRFGPDPWYLLERVSALAVKVAGSSISSIFAFSARPSAQLDLRAHNVGLDTN